MIFGKLHNATTATTIALLAIFGTSTAHATDLVVDVTGIQSFAAQGDAANVVRSYNIGAGSHITNIAYNVNLTAYSPSYLSELSVSFLNSAGDTGLFLNPAFDTQASGTDSYADSVDLVALDLDFSVGADGVLNLEFFESYDDVGINPDGIWNSGTLTFGYTAVAPAVPEPGTYALMLAGLGIVGWVARRRKVA